MSQPIALFPILALIAGILGFSVSNFGLLEGASPARAAGISEFWGVAETSLDEGASEVGINPEGADAVCLIAKGADPIARLFSALGAAPEFSDRATADRLTALELRADTALAISQGAVTSYSERPEWEKAVFLGGATCVKGGRDARVIFHHRPAPFGGPRKAVHLILSR